MNETLLYVHKMSLADAMMSQSSQTQKNTSHVILLTNSKWKSLSHVWLCDSMDDTVRGIL